MCVYINIHNTYSVATFQLLKKMYAYWKWEKNVTKSEFDSHSLGDTGFPSLLKKALPNQPANIAKQTKSGTQ